MSFLPNLVLKKIQEIGVDAAAEFFEVGQPLVRQWSAGSKPVSLAAVEKVFDPRTVCDDSKTITAEWEGKKVAILLPWYKSSNPFTVFSLLGLLDKAKMTVLMACGDAFIAHTRNTLSEQFLKSGIEWSFWLDDDMVVPWGNATWFNRKTGLNLPDKFAGMHTLNRLMSHQKTLVGGLYFGRNSESKPMYSEGCSSESEKEYAKKAPYDLVKATRWVATGCLLVHRQVYLDIQTAFPNLAPQREEEPWNFFSNSQEELAESCSQAMNVLNDPHVSEKAKIEEAFKRLDEGKQSTDGFRLARGEDVTFSLRASKAGHQPFVDMGLIAGHYGNFCYGPRI